MSNLLSTKFATEYCGISKVAIKKAIDTGRLKPAHIDKSKNGNKNLRYYFYLEDLDNYNAMRRNKTNSTKYNTERNVSIMNNEKNIINEVVTKTYTADQNDKFSNNNGCDTTVEDSCISILNINTELENLLPPLSDEQFAQLESEILHDKKIIDPIITWNGNIVDGHNRYKIAKKHNISFDITEKSFKDIEEAKIWILTHQMNRRNISKYESCCLVLKFKDKIAAEAQQRMLAGKSDPTQKSAEGETRDILAKMAGVSHDTLSKVEKLEKAAPPELRDQLKNGEISINAAYNQLPSSKKTKRSKVTQQSTEEVFDTSSVVTSSINNSDMLPAKEESQQYENTDQETTEEPPIAADIKEYLTDNEATPTNEYTEQSIISYIKEFNEYINGLLSSNLYYSTEDDLQKEWNDNITLCPPVELIDSFIEKLNNSNVLEALFIVSSDYDDNVTNNVKEMSILSVFHLLFVNEWYSIFYIVPKENSNEDDTPSN